MRHPQPLAFGPTPTRTRVPLREYAPPVPIRLSSVSLALLTVACGSGSGSRPAPVSQQNGLRAAGIDTAGGGSDAAAAALLLGAPTPIQHGGRPLFLPRSGVLEARMVFHAMAHVEAAALGGDAAAGGTIAGSQRIRRLAAAADAPRDANDNGTNLDEVAAAELADLATRAGASVPAGLGAAWLPWRAATTELLAAPSARDDYGAQRVRQSPAAGFIVTSAQLGGAMLARLHASLRRLADRVGSPADGLRGLVLLQQVVAAEESLVASMFGRDGSLPGLRNARGYDPRTPADALWVPAQLVAEVDPRIPGSPIAYATIDRASSLQGTAALLEAAADLAWLTSARNEDTFVRTLLTVTPFGPGVPRGGAAEPPQPIDGEVSFTSHIKPLAESRCIACHNDFSPLGGYTMGRATADYAKFIAGGNVGRLGNPPHVVAGDHRGSLLWQVLSGTTTRVPRMPLGCGPSFNPCLSPAQLAAIAEWIDRGLQREPSVPPPPPRVGEDLARALVRNLRVLHGDLALPGALHDRYEGDAPSGLVRARSTGAALQALAVAAMALPNGNEALQLLRSAADFAVAHLLDAEDGVLGELAIDGSGGMALLRGGDGVDHAAMVSGLFAAARVLDDAALRDRVRRVSRRWIQDFWAPALGLFRSERGLEVARLGAGDLGVVIAALQETAADGDLPLAFDVHEQFLTKALPVLAASEWDGLGEVLGDGVADTDGNGIAEPALAGGPHGRAPMFFGELRAGNGLPPEPPVSWSETILPLFRAACSGCHTDGASRGDYRLDTPTLAATAGESGRTGELIVPGDPERSLLYRKLLDRRPPVGDQMPLQRPPLSDSARELVRRWIQEGARAR